MRQVVICQFAMFQQRVDMLQTGLWTIAHGNGHGTIEMGYRRRVNSYQLVVKRNNLPPVGRGGRFRLRMNGRDRSLQCVSTEAAGARELSPPMPLLPRSAPGSRARGLDCPAKSALRSERFSRRDGIPAATSAQAAQLPPALAGARSATGPVESPRRLARPALPPLPPQPSIPR